jgi:hypothetical protein
MAKATLQRSEDFRCEEGETAFAFDCDVMERPPYAGPKGTEWSRFECDEDGAVFEWRTGIDRLRDAARRVIDGDWTLKQARKDRVVDGWFERCFEWDEDAAASGGPATEDEAGVELLRAVVRGEIDPADSQDDYAIYPWDWDFHFSDAAHALPLPPWARLEVGMGGGPGSGYDIWYLVLSRGKGLRDLKAWLETRPARKAAKKKVGKKKVAAKVKAAAKMKVRGRRTR